MEVSRLEDIKEIIAENISLLRKAGGMTQIELAEKLNYSDKAVSKWERGESVPDIAVLKQLSIIFSPFTKSCNQHLYQVPKPSHTPLRRKPLAH